MSITLKIKINRIKQKRGQEKKNILAIIYERHRILVLCFSSTTNYLIKLFTFEEKSTLILLTNINNPIHINILITSV